MKHEVEFSPNFELAANVADRAENMGFVTDRTSLIMDIMAADGENGNNPIDFDRWLDSDNGNFMHDLGGIHRNLNRETGMLDNCFLPRFAYCS